MGFAIPTRPLGSAILPLDVRTNPYQYMGVPGRSTPKMWDNRGVPATQASGRVDTRPGAPSPHTVSLQMQRPS